MTDSKKVGPGTVLAGRYELTDIIGRGGFGTVWAAKQLNMDRDVAIKILPEQFMSVKDVVERFKREAKLASRLRHPNTITLHDYGKHENLLYIVMERLHGEDLADVLKREGRIKPERIIHIARQVLKSLAEAHDEHIIHRDLKPENIFLSVVGDDRDHAKVLDFGIAKLTQPGAAGMEDEAGRRLTMSGSTVGTPTYMSPEQAAGEDVDGQTDLYALGIIMYESACGRPPFHHKDPVKVMRAQLFEPVPPMRDKRLQGTLLDRVVQKALQKDRDDRFKTAHDMLRALAGEPVARPVIKGIELDDLDEPSTQEFDLEEPEGPNTDDFAPEDGKKRFPNTLGFAKSIDGSGSGAAAQSAEDDTDAVPFAAVEDSQQAPERESVRSGVAAESSLTTPAPEALASPPASDGTTSSSILTVIDDGKSDDDVILLTKKKTPSDSQSIEREEVGLVEETAPLSDIPDKPPAETPPADSEPPATAAPESPRVSSSNPARSGDQYASWQFAGALEVDDAPAPEPPKRGNAVWFLVLAVLAVIAAGAIFFDELTAFFSAN